ncbi:MAG TPA: PIG-L family deacetylase [Rudaea sp.]|nr:PIG-L family deacetylase [Rudaea sp.]HSC12549.1 PIG-L family deacetylase [Rhodanobacteraceae bacterium]
MSELPGFTRSDRVLVVAPHPDDESIATGGLLQVAHAAGAARRVLLVTDGDNNPWPQRWQEKRWHIGPAERARWGARRRTEALAALQLLGVGSDEVCCLGLPDLGLTDALMRGSPDVVGLLLAQIEEFKPTRLVLPALEDRHPDHSALDVLLRLALLRYSGPVPQLIAFGVHGTEHVSASVTLALTAEQCDVKRAAIQKHTTQMLLSRRRFVAYAKAQEPFRLVAWPAAANPHHPLRADVDVRGDLNLQVDHDRWRGSLRGLALFVVAQRANGESLRYRVALTGAESASIRDARAADRIVGSARISRAASQTLVIVPAIGDLRAGWVKFARPAPGLFVFDRIGWQTIAATPI